MFDGFATKGRLQATRARRDAAVQALEATRRRIASEVRSVFFDLEQADRILEAETKNVQTAADSLQFAKANLAAGLGTQLDILQAASDVTRTRTTRLNGIYLHNVALAKLARACATAPDSLNFGAKRQAQAIGSRFRRISHSERSRRTAVAAPAKSEGSRSQPVCRREHARLRYAAT